MRLSILLSIFVSLVLLTSPGLSQKWGRKAPTLNQILSESNTELIFVGEVDGYSRSYSPGGKGDSTEANYRVVRVLKGDASLAEVLITMPGHIGFGEGQRIVFATTDALRVDKEGVRCAFEPCYFALFDWSLPYSTGNEAKVLKAIAKAKNDRQ